MSRILAIVAVLALAAVVRADDILALRAGTTLRGRIKSRDAETVVIVCDGQEIRVSVAAIVSEVHVAPPIDTALVATLANGKPAERAAAVDEIVKRWPDSAATLDAALAHANVGARLEATRILGRTEIDDVATRTKRMVADADPTVRAAAVRVVRHRRLDGFETDLVSRFRNDVSVAVATECLRALEDVGTTACIQAVFDEWERSRDDARRRRCLRVLRRVTGVDHGDDVEAWRTTVTKAVRDAKPPKSVPSADAK